MNDYAEGNWLTHIISTLCKEKLTERLGDLTTFDALIKNINACIRSKLPYMACFSSKKDLLSQWLGYADGGKGVAIGLKTNALKRSMQNFFQAELPNNLGYSNGFAKVHYPTIEQLRPWLSPELDKVTVHNYRDIAEELSKFSLLFKNPAFVEEDEYRIVAIPQRNLFAPGWAIPNQSFGNSLCFRATGKGISSYFELPINTDAIQNVCLGPLNKSEIDDAMAFLANKSGKKICVFRSTATYCG